MAVKTALRYVAMHGMRIKQNEENTLRLLALLVASDVQFKDEEMGYLRQWFKEHLVRRPGRPPVK